MLLSLNILAQDKTTIPPGPNDKTDYEITREERRTLERKIRNFLKEVSHRKKVCRENQPTTKEKDLVNFYMSLMLMDASFSQCETCKESNPKLPKHHPFVNCLFQEQKLRERLVDVMSDPIYVLELSLKNKEAKALNDMTNYFNEILKEYED